MQLLDYSQTVIKTVFGESVGKTDFTLNEDILRHMILNTIRSHNVLFKKTHGQLVLCIDSKNYWRKDIFENYKGTRKKKKEDSHIDWEQIYQVMDTVKNEIDMFLPFPVVEVERMEADDIIGTLCEYSTTIVDDSSLFGDVEKTKILSSDGDLVQLQKFKNVSQYNTISKCEVKPLVSPTYDLNFKIVTGDTGDCIPGIKSDINCIFDGIRQKPTKATEKDEWSKNPSTIPQEYKNRFEMNSKLVDLSRTPQEYKDKILSKYKEKSDNKKTLVDTYQYFISKRLNRMMNYIEDFQ